MIEDLGQVAQILTHQGDIGRFDGHVGAHGPHGNADVGGGERWRVVDSVTDHGRRPGAGELTDDAGLVLRPKLGVHIGDPGLGGQGGGGGGVVAGEQGDGVAAAGQLRDDRAGLRTELVAHRDGADEPAIVLDEDGGGAGLLHGYDLCFERIGVKPAGPAQPDGAALIEPPWTNATIWPPGGRRPRTGGETAGEPAG